MSSNRPYTFSRAFLLIISGLYLLDYILGLGMREVFAINPLIISDRWEFWRLFLFPAAYSTVEGFLLFAVVFYFISPKLEEIVLSIAYPLWLFLLTFLQGGFMTILFWKSNTFFGGAEGISIFVLALFALLKPFDYIKIGAMPRVPNYILSSLILSSWLAMKFLLVSNGTSESILPAIAVAGFGLGMAGLIFAQVKLIEHFRFRRLQKSHKNLRMPKPEELSVAIMNSKNLKKYYSPEENEADGIVLSNDPYENENILNDILDKINDEGKDSLTILEKRFLEEYSKNMDA